MRILVTGGAGFIGSHLVDALLALGHDVVVLDALSGPVHPEGMWPPYLAREAELVRGDVLDRQAVQLATRGADVIYHCAAYQDYRPDYSTYVRTNVESTALLFESLSTHTVKPRRVILVSSQAVYGEGARTCAIHGRFLAAPRSRQQLATGDWTVHCFVCANPTQPDVMREDDLPVLPASVYGLSKCIAEQVGLRLGEITDTQTLVLRPSIVIGPRQSEKNLYSGACRAFVMAILSGAACVVNEDGQQLRDFVHIEDVVRAMVMLLDADPTHAVFNVGGATATTVNQLLDYVAGALQAKPAVRREATFRIGDGRDAISSTDRLKSLGWSQRGTVREAVSSYVKWVLTNR